MIDPVVLFLLGLIVGILTGFFGVGGGFLMTPALNILGLQMVHAIGTGFSAIVGNTLIGAIRHRKLGNVDLKLGITVGAFSVIGVDLGERLVLHLEKLKLVGTSVRVFYIILLALVSMLMLREYYHYRKTRQNVPQGEKTGSKGSSKAMARCISYVGLSPNISLPRQELEAVSIWLIIASGILIGFISGFMGLGGGFIGLPILIYVIRVPTIVAVGTSLVVVFITSCYGTTVYGLAGDVEWVTALIILAGSAIGVQFGVYATEHVTGMKIKVLFALLLFVVAISVFLKQINIVTISTYLVLGSACALSLVILLPLRKTLLTRL